MKRASGSQLQRLADEFGSSVAGVLGSMTGQDFGAEASLAGSTDPSCEWLVYTLTGPATGTVTVGFTPSAALLLGNDVLSAAGVEADEHSARSTFSELLSQALSAWSQRLSESLGGPLAVDNGRSAQAPSAGECYRISILSGGAPAAELWASPSAEFAAFVKPDQAATQVVAGSPSVSTPPALDLLMDVELPISVSFGRAQLPIKEVLKLSSGSIVELARSVSEPVELIVNNCVIARGEVVVIEGNYGVRIEEIISPQERLRTLK